MSSLNRPSRLFQVNVEKLSPPVMIFAATVDEAGDILEASTLWNGRHGIFQVIDVTDLWLTHSEKLRCHTEAMLASSAVGIANYVIDDGWELQEPTMS